LVGGLLAWSQARQLVELEGSPALRGSRLLYVGRQARPPPPVRTAWRQSLEPKNKPVASSVKKELRTATPVPQKGGFECGVEYGLITSAPILQL
jgi:hypothetical protein